MGDKLVLIVDDSEFDRTLMTKALAQKGSFHTIEASTGEECLEKISSTQVDLILMDIMMPGALGSQVLVKIREKFNPIELPVIMVTAMTKASSLLICLQSGANDYITKPVNFEIAISRIHTHLKLADLSREMSRLREIAALTAMITTYNHEINNPLTVAMDCAREGNWGQPEYREKMAYALGRIRDIVKKIQDVADEQEVDYEAYAGSSQMLKLK